MPETFYFGQGCHPKLKRKCHSVPCALSSRELNQESQMIVKYLPDRMWSKMGTDLFEYNGFHYMLCVDYYSKWIEVANGDNLTSGNIICDLKSENLLGMGYLMSLSVTLALNMSFQHLLISARAMVLSMPHQVLTSLKQMVKLKGQFKTPRISSRKYKILTRHC